MLKSILVHLDGGPMDGPRLDHARAIALAFAAHLGGVLTNLLPAPFPAFTEGSAIAADVLARVSAEAAVERDRAAADAAARLKQLGVPATLHRVDALQGDVGSAVTALARTADLFVAMRPLSDEGPEQWPDLVEAVLFGGGRAVLLVPPRIHPTPVRRVLIAWNGSRESARAVAEAMPFLAQAEHVALAVVDGEAGAGGATVSAAAEHLRHHGLAPEVLTIAMQGRPVARALVETANGFAADLLVMGGYGRSRVREWVLGGATRDMWRIGDVPVLTAH